MPYACRTWGKAVGAFGDTEGSIKDGSVNLSSGTFDLPGENSGFGDEHSGEFNASIQRLKPFYDTLMDRWKWREIHDAGRISLLGCWLCWPLYCGSY